ncbi:MAG: hypothetical protein ACR2JW_19420 [Thermomicrobiales bacterium]
MMTTMQNQPTTDRTTLHARTTGLPFLKIAWILMLLLGAFFVFAALSDLNADRSAGIPIDHTGAFANVTGVSFASIKQSSPEVARYITLLEVAYAVHELVFGILFLVILAIPFRRRMRWAWFACWAVMLANITYSLTFGRHDGTTLYRSLVADIALPILLLAHIPAFFGRHTARTAASVGV